jgi:predicted GIY-YIG superfamily endonuclease
MSTKLENYANCYTFKRRPVKLVYYETIPFLKEAVERETQLKKWSRKKKGALIKQDYHKLHLLSECQNLSHYRYKDLK